VSYFSFKIKHKSKKSRARLGVISTPHGDILTPGFVPVGTNAAIKAVDAQAFEAINSDLIFCNTYHLMLHPGADIVQKAGGIHKFMNRQKPIITDSGGFQVFSLMYGGVAQEIKSSGTKKTDSQVLKISEEGVTFRSYRDGAKFVLTPETSIQAQKQIGADIILAFDELPPYHMSAQHLKRSFDRTHRWEERSLLEHQKNPNNQALYGIIHGGIDPALRQKSAEILGAMDFDGYSIGGSVGKNHEEMFQMLDQLMPHIPEDKPNHLLGIGDLRAIKGMVEAGIDTFDSSYPSKSARHGVLFVSDGVVRIGQTVYKDKFEPVQADCACYTCQNYTAAYLHHLLKAHELSFFTLATIHNFQYMAALMEKYRQMIANDEI
jgi:queuine tRNA-ribosyltransferase